MIKKNVNIAQSAEVYDAIVVGSGISGGWAAKELTEKGMKTLRDGSCPLRIVSASLRHPYAPRPTLYLSAAPILVAA